MTARGRTELARSAPSPRRKAPTDRPRLPPGKGSELIGLLLLLLGLLIAASLLTYNPRDPSLFLRAAEPRPVDNLVGQAGAQIAALAFNLMGPASLLLPILLLLAAWRRLWRRAAPRVAGRGVGAMLSLVALPFLLELTLREVPWRGSPVAAGGVVGRLLAQSLEPTMGFAGALLLAVGMLAIGGALLVQSTLGEVLAAWGRRLTAARERLAVAWARRRERLDRERSRRRVMAKHLELRGAEGAARRPEPAAGLPLRVTEKPGEGGFSLRRVRGAVPPATVPVTAAGTAPEAAATPAVLTAPPPAPPEPPQQKIPFPKPPAKPGTLPPLNLLVLEEAAPAIEESELVRLGELIRSRCAEFGVDGTVEAISPGPVITVFEFQPAPGVKVSQIVNLQDDLALALKAEAVRIDRLPGRSTLGIEVPNRERTLIHLGPLLAREPFRRAPSPLTLALGTTIHGEPYYADLATMPHLLVAGATGSGKSVGLQSMITSIIYKAVRDQVQFIFIDPKRIELGVYGHIPHLKAEVVVEPKKAANALRWAVAEMERRYRLLAEAHVRSIDYYNRAIGDPQVQRRLALSEGEGLLEAADLKPLPYYVVVIDELADLMMVASAEVESSIARLAQMARAVGIHLIVATQRPSVDVLTGTIKANFPCRISYATASRHDSRTILDTVGAEKLLGKGDLLFMPPGTSRILRLHGAYVTEQETAALVRWLKRQGSPDLDPAVLAPPEEERGAQAAGGGDDELFDEAARLVVEQQQASASFLQRRLRIGFSRAARLIDIMEQEGLLGPPQGSKPREVLVKADYFAELDRAREEL